MQNKQLFEDVRWALDDQMKYWVADEKPNLAIQPPMLYLSVGYTITPPLLQIFFHWGKR
jgi:hypothetical protein